MYINIFNNANFSIFLKLKLRTSKYDKINKTVLKKSILDITETKQNCKKWLVFRVTV